MSEHHFAIKELPESERPLSRLRSLGPRSLSTVELLTIIHGKDDGFTVAHELLAKFGSLTDLQRAAPQELCEVAGIGPVTAAYIQVAMELGRRLMQESNNDCPQVRSPADAANLVMPEMMLLEQEQFRVLHLDTKNRVTHITTVYQGSANTALIRVAEVFRDAVRRGTVSIIICHNHPSGDPNPSPEDVQCTRNIVEAGKLMDIEVLDHLVIGRQRFVSLKERGLGFS